MSRVGPAVSGADALVAAIRSAFARSGFGKDPGGAALVRLPEFSQRVGNSVRALLGERFPSGSLKFISVLGMVARLSQHRRDRPVEHVVASTSGNTGVAAAWLFRDTDIKFHAVVDARTAPGKRAELHRLGAEVVEVREPDPTWIAARLRMTGELLQSLPGAVDLDQYSNRGALAGHATFTGPLIWQTMGNTLDVFVSPIGTGGMFGGTAHFLRGANPRIATVPVDCEGSIVPGGVAGPHHLLTGLGAHIRCDNVQLAYTAMFGLRPRVVDDVTAFREAHWIRENDGIWLGGSSGAALAAVTKISREIQGKNIVVLCPDGGESYAETIFNPAWLAGHGLSI